MPAYTGAFSHLLAPGLRKVFYDDYKEWAEEYSRLCNVITSKRAYEEELVVAGLGRHEKKPEGEPLTYDVGIQGGKVRYTHASFALGFRVGRELWQDDLYGVMKKMSKQLAMSARQTTELEFASLLDDAFDGNTYVGADEKSLCNTAHTLLSGGSHANRPTTDVDFGIGPLRSALERMEKTPNERGLLIQLRGKLIVVSPTYQWAAKEILGTEKAPYTAENQINALRDLGLNYFVWHFGGDDDAWWLFADKPSMDVKFLWRQKPMFENSDDFDTKDAKFSSFMRFSYGFTDWRGVDGSSGG
jgi:hypothetical protein